MAESEPVWTAGGNRQRPQYQTLVDFASQALLRIDRQELVRRSFAVCGLIAWPEYENFRDFFENFNSRLLQIVNPDYLNMSGECLLSLRRAVMTNDAPSFDEYLSMIDFQYAPSPNVAKNNRRASQAKSN